MKKDDESTPLPLLQLPDLALEKILSFLSFEEVAHLRLVCRKFNELNQGILNKGFRRVEKYQAKCLKEVKSQLPRRESERRSHPLYRHCDILTAVETRLSLLNMTFIKYVDSRMCCFIPGKVIDEIYRVLHIIQTRQALPRAHELLTELRDISSMAMEHFEEKIIRTLQPKQQTILTSPSSSRSPLTSSSPLMPPPSSPSSLPGLGRTLNSPPSSELTTLMNTNKYYKYYINTLKVEIANLKLKLIEIRRKVSEQERVALEQNRQMTEQNVKLASQETKLNEVNKKMLEYDQRFSEVLGELARLREERGAGRPREDKVPYESNPLATPTLSSTVFLAANMVQPNLVQLNLAPGALPSPAYLPSSTLAGYASPGLTLTLPHIQEESPSSSPTPGCSSTHCSSPALDVSSSGSKGPDMPSTSMDAKRERTKSFVKKLKKKRKAPKDPEAAHVIVKVRKIQE